MVREILSNDVLTSDQKSTELADAVERLALTPLPDQQPLPPIDEDDIRLTCWIGHCAGIWANRRSTRDPVVTERHGVAARVRPSRRGWDR